jgi:hypothetical protein
VTPGGWAGVSDITRGQRQESELDMGAGPPFRSASRPEFMEGTRVPRTQQRDIDWHAIERDYRASLLSLRELALKLFVKGASHAWWFD